MDSLCVSRGQPPGRRPLEVQEVSRRGTPVELHNTAGDKPAGGKSIFDRTFRVFQPLARTLGGQGFPPKRRVDASVQVHDGRVLRFFSDRTIALFSCLYIDKPKICPSDKSSKKEGTLEMINR